MLECQFQIRSLLDGNSIDAFRKTQLEKTCQDLQATVSDLSLSLTRLRDMKATHEKTLDDLAEARSNITQLKSQLQASQIAQERTASELEKVKSTLVSVKDGAEIAATTQAKTLSELNTVRAALADAERNSVASQKTQDNTASELREARLSLEKMRSELSAAHKRCEKTESQMGESLSALERMELELVKPREAPPFPSPWVPKLPGINGIPDGGEGEEEVYIYPPHRSGSTPSPWSPPSSPDMISSTTTAPSPRPWRTTELRPQSPFWPDLMGASHQQPVTFHTPPPVHPDSRAHWSDASAPSFPHQQHYYSGGYAPQQSLSFPMPQGPPYPFGTPVQPLAPYY